MTDISTLIVWILILIALIGIMVHIVEKAERNNKYEKKMKNLHEDNKRNTRG